MGKSNEAERVRREISEARGDLGQTLEEIGDRVNGVRDSVTDKVSPRRRAERGADKVKGSVRKVKESVAAGAAERGTNGPARRRTGRATAAPQAVARKAGSNPFAAGLVAFGGGVLLASILKSTDRERQAAQQVKAKVEPLKGKALEAGRTMAEDLQQKATQAGVDQVKQRAAAALKQVREDARASAGQANGANGAGSGVKPRARTAKARARGAPASRPSAGSQTAGAAGRTTTARTRPRASTT